MSTERNIVVDLNIDLSGFIAGLHKAAQNVRNAFGVLAPDDLSRNWPTCPGVAINERMHEFWATKDYPCPSCGAAV